MNRKSFVVDSPGLPPGIVALPVRTRLVSRGDALPRLIADAVRGIASPSDVVCVSETALAIAQGRAIPAELIRPGKLARILSNQAGPYSTVSQAESMQLVIENVGSLKVLAAAAAGAVGKLVGRRGDFYRILGPAISEIDGYTGTMPPYERHIVFGPVGAEAAAAEIARACGTHAAIVDVNDYGTVKILAATESVNHETVTAALRGNPHGNADEQTPIVVLKYRAPSRNSERNLFVQSSSATQPAT